jgi:hypothetical protein
VPVADFTGQVNDVVRYTVQVPAEGYTVGVRQVVTRLRAEGFELASPSKNTWHEAGYKGINSWWRDPGSGQLFEIQFHTPESFDAKMVTHDIYKQARLLDVDDPARAALDLRQDEIFATVPRPDGAVALRLEGLVP